MTINAYILVLIISSSSGEAATAIEFDSLKNCQSAKEGIVQDVIKRTGKDFFTNKLIKSLVCVKK